ncbi:MAG: hypothetical protein ACE147_13790 [Candidatus Methylomirabilales bacterium]
MIRYEHTQRAAGLQAGLIAGAAACGLLSQVAAVPPAIPVAAAVVLVLAAYVFSSLTVVVTEEALIWAFGPGVIRKQVRLADIQAAGVTLTRWYEGWGIHRTRRGWLYNVSGFQAVAITLKDGRRILLGTDEPARLQAAITRAAGLPGGV